MDGARLGASSIFRCASPAVSRPEGRVDARSVLQREQGAWREPATTGLESWLPILCPGFPTANLPAETRSPAYFGV